MNHFSSWRADHVGIRVPDFDAAVGWYTTKLGLRLLTSFSRGEMTFGFLALGESDDIRIELLAGPGVTSGRPVQDLHDSLHDSGWHHFCLHVDDVDAALTELRRRDVRIVSEPVDVAEISVRFAFFADPWGNLFELMETIDTP